MGSLTSKISDMEEEENLRKSIVSKEKDISRPGRNGGKLLNTKKGQPSPNPAGLPKGTLHSKTIIRKWLEAVEKAKNPISGQSENLTQLDIITLKQLEKARKGDTTAFRELLDRMEGKTASSIELTGKDGKDLQPQPIMFLSVDSLTDDQIEKYIIDAGDNNEGI